MKTWVEISKARLLHNVREITKRLGPETCFMAVLKSNAYGHGTRKVAELLLRNPKSDRPPEADPPLAENPKLWFGVDSIEEALALQKIPGANKIPTLILGYVPRASLNLVPQNVRLTVYNFETIKASSAINKKFKVHIKIETGTQRQGIALQELPKFIKAIKRLGNIEIEGISSHFAEAENIDFANQNHSLIRANKKMVGSSEFTKQQLKNFYNATQIAEKLLNKKLIKHIACSAATSHFRESQCDMVRVGINLYGLQSINTRTQEHKNTRTNLLNLKPVLSWKTIVAQIKDVQRGAPIGYGRTEKMPYDGQIAILPIGYWDGYNRRLSSVGEVIIGGQRCKNIGRVCMNMSMALLPPKIRAKPEDEVVLIGKQAREEVTADQLAAKIGTINYEVVTRINPLITRIIS